MISSKNNIPLFIKESRGIYLTDVHKQRKLSLDKKLWNVQSKHTKRNKIILQYAFFIEI